MLPLTPTHETSHKGKFKRERLGPSQFTRLPSSKCTGATHTTLSLALRGSEAVLDSPLAPWEAPTAPWWARQTTLLGTPAVAVSVTGSEYHAHPQSSIWRGSAPHGRLTTQYGVGHLLCCLRGHWRRRKGRCLCLCSGFLLSSLARPQWSWACNVGQSLCSIPAVQGEGDYDALAGERHYTTSSNRNTPSLCRVHRASH